MANGWERCGLVCNQASVNDRLTPAWKICSEVLGERLVALFGPQHGFESTVQDNMIETGHGTHVPTGLPVYSLYSETREPTPTMLSGLDTIIVDLQIIGCRVYTYKYTLAACLRAAKRYGKRVVVLDRPNPLGGIFVEGNRLNLAVKSFVGEFPIPMRHGMTAGEAAQLFNRSIGAELQVLTLDGWNPAHVWTDLHRPWVITSPNMPTAECAYTFPGTVLYEGTNLSEGRGTTLPFLFIGAPYIKSAQSFADLVLKHARSSVRGMHLRPTVFQPTFQKWSGKDCAGFQIHVLDPHVMQPYYLGLAILRAAIELGGSQFGWKSPPYEYETKKDPIDLLLGIPECKRWLTSDQFDLRDQIWSEGIEDFVSDIAPSLLYDRKMQASVPK
jgi:uncharacterized protein YbbC (DUF1343 family)